MAGAPVLKTKAVNSGTKRSATIIGAGLGGLSTAIHLSAAGYSVTIFEADARIGGRANVIEQDGYRFDTGPSLLNYPWVFEQLFAAAGADFYKELPLYEVDPGISFSWPDGKRLALSSNYDRLLAEFEKFDPGCGPRLMAWLRHCERNYNLSFEKLVPRNEDNALRWIGGCPPGAIPGLDLHRSLYSALRRFFRSEHICQALGSYGMYLGGSPYDLPGLFGILAYGELAHGLWLPHGGMYALIEAVGRLAENMGTEIHCNARVEEIIVKGGEARGVRLQDGTVQRSDVVISNCDLPTTDSMLLPEGELRSKYAKRAESTRMTPGVVTFYMGIRGRLSGIGHHSIYFPRDYRRGFDELFSQQVLSEEPPFYVAVPSETDKSLAPEGCSAVFVLVPTPVLSALGETDWDSAVSRFRSHVLARLRSEGVTLDESMIEFEQVMTPADWGNRFGLYDGSAFGAAHGLFELGPFRARNYNPDVRGLYYAGASTTPGTGLPLVAIGGKMTAERVMALSR